MCYRHLTHLDLSFNQLESLPSDFRVATSLKCPLRSNPQHVSVPTDHPGVSLDLSFNQLNSLPSGFRVATSLKYPPLFALHSTSYTLHPSPYTLNHIPSALIPKP